YVAAEQLGELDSEQRTAGSEIDPGREMLLDNETGGSGGEGMALAAEEGSSARLRYCCQLGRHRNSLQSAICRIGARLSGADPRGHRRAAHLKDSQHVALAINDGNSGVQFRLKGLGDRLCDYRTDVGGGEGIGGGADREVNRT